MNSPQRHTTYLLFRILSLKPTNMNLTTKLPMHDLNIWISIKKAYVKSALHISNEYDSHNILVPRPASYLHPGDSHGFQVLWSLWISSVKGFLENAESTVSVRSCSGPQSILPPCTRCWDRRTDLLVPHQNLPGSQLSSSGWEIPEPSPNKHTESSEE